MGQLDVRPQFDLSTSLDPEEIVARLRAGLAQHPGTLQGLFLGPRVELLPDPSRVRFWSPQLTLQLSVSEEGTHIRGRFGPHPHVWTLYVALHALGAFGTIGATMYGISQHLAGQSPWALWALPASPVLAALVWALAFIGQNLGREQCYGLRRFVEEALAG